MLAKKYAKFTGLSGLCRKRWTRIGTEYCCLPIDQVDVVRRLRFTITRLLYLVALAAILIAIYCSENAGERNSLLTSLDFSPDGRRLAVCLHEFNGFDKNRAPKFDRTIYLIDFPSFRTNRTMLSDQQQRSLVQDVPRVARFDPAMNQNAMNVLYWHSQTKVLLSHHHLFYLDPTCQKLICCEIDTGLKRPKAVFEVGQIFDFDVSEDGRQILFQGETADKQFFRDATGEVIVHDELSLIPNRTIPLDSWLQEKDKFLVLAYHDVLGIDATKPVVVPVDKTAPPDEIRRTEKEQAPQLAQDNDVFSNLSEMWKFNMPLQPMKWRLAFVPNGDEPDVAIITTNDQVRLRLGEQNKGPDLLDQKIPNWTGTLVDVDVSNGDCKNATLLASGKVNLNIMTDKLYGTDNANAFFRCSSLDALRLCLSRDGRYLAIAFRNSIRIFKVDNLIPKYEPGMMTQLQRLGGLPVQPEIEAEIPLDCKPMSIVFSPDENSLLVGDSEGTLSVYDCQSGTLQTSTKISGKPRGLRKEIVVPILVFWLFLGFVWVFFSRTNSLPEQQ